MKSENSSASGDWYSSDFEHYATQPGSYCRIAEDILYYILCYW